VLLFLLIEAVVHDESEVVFLADAKVLPIDEDVVQEDPPYCASRAVNKIRAER